MVVPLYFWNSFVENYLYFLCPSLKQLAHRKVFKSCYFTCSSVCWSCSLLKRFYISCICLCIFGSRGRKRLVELRGKGRLMRPNLCIPTGTKITNRDPARTTGYPSYGAQLGKTLRRQLYTPTGESQESKPSSNHCQISSKTDRLSHVLVICRVGYMILPF